MVKKPCVSPALGANSSGCSVGNELTYLIAKFPYLMQKPLAELLSQGLTRVIVDINNSGLPASEIGSVVHRLLSGPQITGGSAFNYYRALE